MEVKAHVRVRRIPPPSIGRMLTEARARSGLGQLQASRMAGLSQGYLWHLEHGTRTPSLAVAQSLAAVLRLTAAECHQLYGVAVTDAGRCHPSRTEHQAV